MEAKVVRENTLKLKFGPQSRNPTNAEVFAFFQKQGWDCDMLSAMYREDFSLFIKFQNEEMLNGALRKLGTEVMFDYENGTKIQLEVSAANGIFKYVRVFGLPPEVDDKHIMAIFSKYGTIHQMVRERYSAELGFPIWNGIRGLNMELVQDIPAQVYVQSIKARVFYDGIQYKCFLCGSTEHLKAECPKRKSINTRLSTYAHPLVNRTGLNNERSSIGSVILPCPGITVKDLKANTECEPVGVTRSSLLVKRADAAGCGEGQQACDELGVTQSEGVNTEKQASSANNIEMEWRTVKRLRSKEANGGVMPKNIKMDERKGRSLLELQSRRARSLTPRQKGGNEKGKEEQMELDKQNFPSLGKS